MKQPSTRNKLLGTAAIVLIILAIAQAWNIPRASLEETIEPNQVVGPVYRGEHGAFDQFYVSYKFKNQGRAEVEITSLEATILLNGTNYNSQEVTHNLATVKPGSEAEIIRVVQLSNAPISFQEGQKWNVTLVTEVVAESSYLVFTHKKTITETVSIDWEVHMFD